MASTATVWIGQGGGTVCLCPQTELSGSEAKEQPGLTDGHVSGCQRYLRAVSIEHGLEGRAMDERLGTSGVAAGPALTPICAPPHNTRPLGCDPWACIHRRSGQGTNRGPAGGRKASGIVSDSGWRGQLTPSSERYAEILKIVCPHPWLGKRPGNGGMECAYGRAGSG
jgi:hypothetical protein